MRFNLVFARLAALCGAQGLNFTAVAEAAIDAMNNAFYSPADGRWSPGDAWWPSGVALTSVVDYMRKTGSGQYLSYAHRIIQAQRAPLPWWPHGAGEFRAQTTDDTAWWALAMVRMYDLTGSKEYLDIALKDEAYMYQYWTDADCQGGIYVDIETKTYKNAIANELYIKLAASLYNRLKGQQGAEYLLTRAERAWFWFRESGMINSDNLVNDGLVKGEDGLCYNNKLPVWTYNQGVILGGLVGMYFSTP
jgi:predicted alpha-1,6-mannanase (GH76 family)